MIRPLGQPAEGCLCRACAPRDRSCECLGGLERPARVPVQVFRDGRSKSVFPRGPLGPRPAQNNKERPGRCRIIEMIRPLGQPAAGCLHIACPGLRVFGSRVNHLYSVSPSVAPGRHTYINIQKNHCPELDHPRLNYGQHWLGFQHYQLVSCQDLTMHINKNMHQHFHSIARGK